MEFSKKQIEQIEQVMVLLEPINENLKKINENQKKIINYFGVDITDNQPVRETLINKLDRIDKDIKNLISSVI